MKMNWEPFIGYMVNVTMHENYGLTFDSKNDQNLYEIVFKTGKISAVYEDGLLLETLRENHKINIFIPLSSIKCVEMFDIKVE